MTRPILITGGAGFIGCNLADRLAGDGHDVLALDSLCRDGVQENLAWLCRRHPRRVSAVVADIRDSAALEDAVAAAGAVFHFAAQVAVTTSLAAPAEDFEVNLRSTLHLLEALRCRNPQAPVVFASTNKVYGDLSGVMLQQEADRWRPCDEALHAHGVSEDQPVDFHTPYGCSKGAADQYVLDYARSFGLRAAVLRMSCIYGQRQRGTEDQGWVAHFALRALAGEPIAIYGDGRQVRDVLHVDDAVEAYVQAWERIDAIRGRAFNLGGGPENAVSLLQVVQWIEGEAGAAVHLRFAPWRAGDQRWFVTDPRRARAALGLPRPIGWKVGLRRLVDALSEELTPMAAAQ